ncbi:MAG: hypothetical protein M1840_000945 [Geoglossum simile]|nr:MAG: hypothetical protein M1840_000945 [Geoglossum simile]
MCCVQTRDFTLPLVIPYDGPNYFNDEEITDPVPLSDPSLQPVSWEELKTLDSRSTVVGSPWGQFYKLKYETDSEWEKSYHISQAVKSLENTAEQIREARDIRNSLEVGSAFSSNATQSSLFGGFGGFGGSNQKPPTLFGSPFAGLGSTGTGSSAFGQGSIAGLGMFSRRSSAGVFARGNPPGSGIGADTGGAIIEHYALLEVPSYPPTDIPGVTLRDWFVGGNDSLENAFITAEKTEDLQKLLLALSKPGFEVMLAVKLPSQKPDILRISCASAYAIKILHRQGRESFDLTLLHAPSSVLLDTALFARGALIHSGIEHKVLQAAAIALTTPESKDAKEVTYARAVAVMVARIIGRIYTENAFAKDEGERAAKLEEQMAALIRDVFEKPVTSPAPNPPPTPNPRAAVTAAAALCALILAGALTFADELQQRREKEQQRAEFAVGAALSCIGFAVPVPYFSSASGLATILGTIIVRHIWKPRDPGLKTALVIQTLQTVLWPLVRRREVLPVGLAGLSFEEVSEFKMFFELTLQSAWMGYWQRA